ncbi:Arm DNA-binding domain-containing protein [Alteromonas sp. CYL-A6]|uniref:Arm DNA-binding domain-containing protein n=1 Tax=Alteromonas nitratireducens TaxID=3390813 RepID=UPI0034BB0737
MTKPLSDFVKDFPGIHLRGESLAIDFRYQGVRCRETLKGMKATKANVKWAVNKRNVVLHEIAQGTFDYRTHFPDSVKADLFSPVTQVPTVGEALDAWLDLKQHEVRKETYRHYVADSDNHIKPKFGNRKLDEITQSEIKRWRMKDLGQLSNKTINDICIPLRGIYETAMGDRIIDFNPMAHVKNLKRDKANTADPFTKEELQQFAEMETHREGERNAFLFACFTGLSVSEWMALAWEDVDLEKRTVTVNRSVVRGSYSLPKEEERQRTINLLDTAYEYLLRQKEHTFMNPKQEISVYDAVTRKTRKDKITFVFIDSVKQEPFTDSARASERFFDHWLKKLGIRHRGVNQARHTFASHLLTQGVAERWIVKQMGHTSIAMLEKHYGRWMDQEMPQMAAQASKVFGLVTSGSQAKFNIV